MALHRSGLKDYTMVLWYTGEATGGPANASDLSLIDQARLGTWLKEGLWAHPRARAGGVPNQRAGFYGQCAFERGEVDGDG